MHRLKRILRNEAGFALPMALVLMLLGGFLVGASVNLVATTLKSNIVIEQRTEGLYAADAGIEDVVWGYKFSQDQDPFSEGNSYQLDEQINGMTVTVEKLVPPEGTTYLVKSIACLTEEVPCPNEKVKGEIIAGLVGGFDFSWLFDHAITSASKIDLKSTDVIYGDIICGGDIDENGATIYGDVKPNDDTVKLPTEAMLTAFYLAKVDSVDEAPYYYPDDGYPYSTYNVPGGTIANPHMIPSMYRVGGLEITGSGYAQLSGTIFLTGKFELSNKDVTLDLNGQSIYTTANSGCPDCNCEVCPGTDAVYFGSGSQLRGPGCVIAVGNINFQPSFGQGKYLLGADPDGTVDTGTATEFKDRVLLSKFQATENGQLSSIQVKCYIADEAPPAHVKVAIYADNAGAPGTRLGTVDCTDNITVSSWKPVSFPEGSQIPIVKKTDYWLAAIADADIISTNTVTWTSKYVVVPDFTSFQFPESATALGPLSNPDPARQYMLRGFSGGQEFILLMSVCCTTNLQPSASFYGSVVGNAAVNLQPGCFINLVGTPGDGLDFPGIGAGSGEGGTTDLEMRTYTIQ